MDSRQPHATVTEGDARVGAWRDEHGKHHLGKAYFTFDVTRFAGTSVFGGSFVLTEESVADCTAPRATEVWVVTPEGPVTWAAQPEERGRLPVRDSSPTCGGRSGWDVGPAVAEAVAAGRDTLTLAVRISDAHQGDVAFGRTVAVDPWLTVDYNTPPGVPTGVSLRSGSRDTPCGAEPLLTGSRALSVVGRVSDPDGTWVSTRTAFWPVADPSARVELVTSPEPGGPFIQPIPAELVEHGGAYAFEVRAEDGHTASAWSATCVFTTDLIAPDRAPTVTSDLYRESSGYPGDGGVGVPGEFTFTANGVADVVRFEYWGTNVSHGAVDAVDGTATVTVTPTRDGPGHLSVVSLDAAGHRSPERIYQHWVRDTRPTVEAPFEIFGEPFAVTFRANQENAKTVHYTVGGDILTAPLAEDGTAVVELEFPAPPGPVLRAWTTTADGTASQVAALDFAGPVEEL
ncbi:hypothetical protein [Actinokineospora fastidiosa]|uniref:Uncharacterized protein n=1 Tax=Actinokineospora fastidiosa TaxID=1816 RepID=A0A918LAS8_9PSEU|nr:hypothetical protein [Actinokineospora fastidiosa]GGS24539.1 hypothetical protein GCM10010171_17140 [Actinokineospora fastidiosa]